MARKVMAETILDNSVEDIQAGLWYCGALEMYRPGGGDGKRGLPRCAIGLVSFHEKGKAHYPVSECNPRKRGSEQMNRVFDALLAGAPKAYLTQLVKQGNKRAKKFLAGESMAVYEKQDLIVDINDLEGVNARKALRWFRQARAALVP